MTASPRGEDAVPPAADHGAGLGRGHLVSGAARRSASTSAHRARSEEGGGRPGRPPPQQEKVQGRPAGDLVRPHCQALAVEPAGHRRRGARQRPFGGRQIRPPPVPEEPALCQGGAIRHATGARNSATSHPAGWRRRRRRAGRSRARSTAAAAAWAPAPEPTQASTPRGLARAAHQQPPTATPRRQGRVQRGQAPRPATTTTSPPRCPARCPATATTATTTATTTTTAPIAASPFLPPSSIM